MYVMPVVISSRYGDRFVKAKKKVQGRSDDPDGNKPAPPILEELRWLSQLVENRETDQYGQRCMDYCYTLAYNYCASCSLRIHFIV